MKMFLVSYAYGPLKGTMAEMRIANQVLAEDHVPRTPTTVYLAEQDLFDTFHAGEFPDGGSLRIVAISALPE